MNMKGCAQIAAEVISQTAGVAETIGEFVSTLNANKEINK